MVPPLRAPVAGLVLAAGAGRRLGQPKALLVVDGSRLVDRAVETLRAGGVSPVLVVAGPVDLAVPGAQVVLNPDWRTGMGSSLRVGLTELRSLAPAPDAVVVALVDQPGIGAEVVRRLVTAHAGGAAVAAATYGGVARNPVLFAREVWAGLSAQLAGDRGARDFLAAHPELVTPVECADIADPFDLDTADDVDAWARRTAEG